MWHDQGENLAAAEALQDALKLDPTALRTALMVVGRTKGGVRARMNYFYACHWQEQGDLGKQREYVDEAIHEDPAEIDALIARYRLPNAAPDDPQKTLELIGKAAGEFRERIRQSPEDPRAYNEFAWLIGNTEGDLDEALRYAQKAVELSPDNGAFLDTLAHVYFGRGDVENAVKWQTEAVKFEPHSGLILRKLGVFRNALQKRRKGEGRNEEATSQPQGEKHEEALRQRHSVGRG
jgi:tetratricopeptide (TPR) repeat protein